MNSHSKLKILFVEDEPVTHEAICRALNINGYHCRGEHTLRAALQAVREQYFDIVICDVMLPDGSGFDLLRTMRSMMFDTPFVVITSSDKKSLIQEALQQGADDFISKPFNLQNLPTMIERNIARKQLFDRNKTARKASVLLKAIQALITALEAKDSYTSGHSMRVARHAALMAEALQLSEGEQFTLELAAILHDIGKIGMPDNILKKAESLQDIEYTTAKEHVIIGSKIVGKIDELKEVAAIIRHHHERYDGSGYPDGLKGEVIPYFARILAIVDAYESIVSERVYSKSQSVELALSEIEKNAGSQFDPALVEIFIRAQRDSTKEGHLRLPLEDTSA